MEDKYSTNKAVMDGRARYLGWMRDFLAFNKIENHILEKEIENLVFVSSNFPQYFLNNSNPNIATFMKNMEVINIIDAPKH